MMNYGTEDSKICLDYLKWQIEKRLITFVVRFLPQTFLIQSQTLKKFCEEKTWKLQIPIYCKLTTKVISLPENFFWTAACNSKQKIDEAKKWILWSISFVSIVLPFFFPFAFRRIMKYLLEQFLGDLLSYRLLLSE